MTRNSEASEFNEKYSTQLDRTSVRAPHIKAFITSRVVGRDQNVPKTHQNITGRNKIRKYL